MAMMLKIEFDSKRKLGLLFGKFLEFELFPSMSGMFANHRLSCLVPLRIMVSLSEI